MIARTFHVLLFLTVSIGSAFYFANTNPNWSALLKLGEKTAISIYHHLSEVGSVVVKKLTEVADDDGFNSSLDTVEPPKPARVTTRDNSRDKSRDKSADFDREGLELLFADAQDFEEELEFVVPKPVRARRPRLAKRLLPIKPPIEFLRVPRPKLAARPKPATPTRKSGTARRIPDSPRIAFRGNTRLVAFKQSPFPYEGATGLTRAAFLNVAKDGRRGHKTRSGRVYWADTTYNETRSLLHVPKGFDVETPGVMVVYFHGWGAKLDRDIWRRQRLPQQITASGTNAVLVAPQFAVDARDSSIGNFRRPGALRDYLDEAAHHLAKMAGRPDAAHVFLDMPVVLVGYSGGYVPTAFGLARGGISDRVLGVVLLDALYGQLGTFTKWIKRSRHTFFVSAYMSSTRRGNARLKSVMKKNGIAYEDNLGGRLQPGSVKIIHAAERHRNYVTQAWGPNPVADVLRKIPGLPRRNSISQRLTLR